MNTDELVKLITEIVKEKINKNEIPNLKKTEGATPLVPVGISARHVHLCKEHLEILFGKGHELTKKKELMGGQYAAEECVTILGSKLSPIEKVRILGPLRKESQVEISSTDGLKLGIKAPARASGNLKGSAHVVLVGPQGTLYLEEGCIIAKRHIHMSPSDAAIFNVKDNDLVGVKVGSDRGGIFKNVQVRVDPTYTLEMHIDTDEANALGIKCGAKLELVK